jgi:hypothetical protein
MLWHHFAIRLALALILGALIAAKRPWGNVWLDFARTRLWPQARRCLSC